MLLKNQINENKKEINIIEDQKEKNYWCSKK